MNRTKLILATLVMVLCSGSLTQAGPVSVGGMFVATSWLYTTDESKAPQSGGYSDGESGLTTMSHNMPLYSKQETDGSSAANFAANISFTVTQRTASSLAISFSGSASNDANNNGEHYFSTAATADSEVIFKTTIPLTLTLNLTATPTMKYQDLTGNASGDSRAEIDVGPEGQRLTGYLFNAQHYANNGTPYDFVVAQTIDSKGDLLTNQYGVTTLTMNLDPGSYDIYAFFEASTVFDSNVSTGGGYGAGYFTDPGMTGTASSSGIENNSLVATPAPASLTLLGIGVVCLGGYGWRRRKLAAA